LKFKFAVGANTSLAMAKQAQAKRPASKGKDKKAQRKAELEKLKQTEVVVVAANEVQDLLEPFAAFRRYARRGVDADVTFILG